MAVAHRLRTPVQLAARVYRSSWFARLFGVGLGLLAWYLVALNFPNELMPYPLEAAELTIGLFERGIVMEHLIPTLTRTLFGFTGALLVGGVLGVLMGINNYGRRFLTPYVVAGLSVPAVAWAAVTTIVFGFSDLAPISAAILIVFPYVAVNVWTGVENIDPELIKMAKAFDVSNRRILFRSILPNTAPALFSAFRFSLAISWKIVTLSEIFASSGGIGQKIIQAYNTYHYEEAWAWAIIFMVVVLLIEYGLLRPLERRVFRYRSEAEFDTIAG